ncbi:MULTISPECIES: anhydro-N-acetylmuramic acid kinase [Rhodomicrobium]|uniref:anhydro-N-acetylmuramic acid kinase n=1 Tax=Rhodomicrobium TaxID=1068 RepID=UPI000B4AF5CF|nr:MULTISPECIES: anhydro-N-acetylmuramic acid kinase [Rhodomicrobium]
MKAIGMMSGTSMDGVDVALIETDGETIIAFGPTGGRDFSEDERTVLREAVAQAERLTDREARPGILARAEQLVTEIHADAVEALLADHGIARESIDVVGFHGQTVLHRPETGLTVQLGDGQMLADFIGLPVVYDFRASDMAAGGEGAPFVPVYHRALAEAADLPRPAVIVNIGGVANVTFIGEDNALLAFDTGPGNALIDDWMLREMGEPRDENGQLAAMGLTDGRRLEAMLADPFFLRKPPKSLDRNEFSLSVVDGLSPADGAATLTAFTAASLICGIAHFPAAPKIFVLSGGGTRNATLVGALRKLLPGRIALAGDFGWDAGALEAQAFAFMAVRSQLGLPISFPGTTGVAQPMTGGVFAEPSEPWPGESESGFG